MHRLVDRGPPGPLASVYVHVPFCRDRCSYCAFATVADDPTRHAAVVDALLAEARRYAPLPAWRTLYLGGGTPGLLSPALLGTLLDGLGRDAVEELTLEVNPANVTRSALDAWSDLGITRLSVGVQTFHDPALMALGRRHDAARARAALELVAAHWHGTWSADLLLGWPDQTRAQLATDLEQLTALAPPHVSLYPLELDPGSALASRALENPKRLSSLPYLYINERLERETLAAAGLARYEVSNFARPDHESRHNQVYWANAAYLGLGPGAASSVGPLRWSNRRDTRAWLERAVAGRDPRASAERLAPGQRLLESLAVGLRTRGGVPLRELERRFGPAWSAWLDQAAGDDPAELGLQRADGHLRLTPAQRLRADAVLAALARRWPDDEPDPP